MTEGVPEPERRSIQREWLLVTTFMLVAWVGWALFSRLTYGPHDPWLHATWTTYLSSCLSGIPLLMAMLYILHIRRVGWSRLGWTPGRQPLISVLEGLALAAGMFALSVLAEVIGLLDAAPDNLSNLAGLLGEMMGDPPAPERSAPYVALGILSAVLAGVSEETFRAYVLVRTGDAWGSRKLGVILSVVFFSAVHVYYPGGTILLVAAWGLVYAIYFVFRWNLLAMIVAHAAWDIYCLDLF